MEERNLYEPPDEHTRSLYRELVCEFAYDLRTFARGDYLRPEEKEFWDPPYDAAYTNDVREALADFLRGLDVIDHSEGTALLSVANLLAHTMTRLNELNRETHWAMLEQEEQSDLYALFERVLLGWGYGIEQFADLIEFE